MAFGTLTLALVFFAVPLTTEAQKSLPRIGLLSIGTDPDPSKPNAWGPLVQQLQDLGYVEGQTVTIERHFAGGRQERLGELVADLARLRVDVVVATGDIEAIEAKRAMPTTAIVMMFVQDPVGVGLVASLARPGGNVTGLTTLAPELYAKRFEILKATLPGVSHVGLLFNPASPSAVAVSRNTATAAQVLGLHVRNLTVRSPDDLSGALSKTTRAQLQAVVVVTDGVSWNQRAQIAEAAVRAHLPTMCDVRNFVDAGCLIAYGASYADLAQRAGIFVDKILRGAKPADLPVEQPTKFELVINMKTAKALSITIPQEILLRVDKVIE